MDFTGKMKHRINLQDDTLFEQGQRNIAPSVFMEVKPQLQELLGAGVIQKSNNSWASNIVLLRKKGSV